MKIIDVLTAPWAIEPGKLLEIQSIYATHLRGDRIDVAAVEKRLGRPLANTSKAYDIVDGVAILSIDGVIAKKMNMFSQISGGTSSEMVKSDLTAALSDPAVHSIILSIDSPGGTVDGTQLLADAIFAARSIKPIVSLASGTMASAAYWAGSAASKIYIADGTTAVGSIGVVTSHKDISAAESAKGITTTEISAGKFKRIASQYGPLSAEGRQSIQDQLDYTYSLFVSAVATNRGVSADTVLSDMADGRIFIGQQAIDAGLVDGIATVETLVAQLNQDHAKSTSQRTTERSGATRSPSHFSSKFKGNTMLTAEQVASEHPQIAEAFRVEGATAERDRIQGIEAQLIPGHDALINTLKFDGKTSPGDAAQAVLSAEKSLRHQAATALAADAPKPLVSIPQSAAAALAADAEQPVTRTALDASAKEYMKANPGVDYITAYKAVGGL